MHGWPARQEATNSRARRNPSTSALMLVRMALHPMSNASKVLWYRNLARHYRIPNMIANSFGNDILMHLRAVRNGGHRYRAVNKLVRPHVRNNPNNINWIRAINSIVQVKKGNFGLINSNSNNNSSNGNR